MEPEKQKIEAEVNAFVADKTINIRGLDAAYNIGFNLSNQTIMIFANRGYNRYEKSTIKYLNFKDIIDCESDSLHSTSVSKENVGKRAAVGGLIAGDVGAVIGASTAKEHHSEYISKITLTIFINDILNPKIQITSLTDFDQIKELQATIKAIIAAK